MTSKSRGNDQSAALSLVGVHKTYGKDIHALRGISLEIDQGAFVTLLGPSGSGKTTLLMTVAGFERPTAGKILSRGVDITDVPPQRRNFGVVFQNYALFPQMTVRGNISYPLVARHVERSKRVQLVNDALELMGLHGLGDRRPGQLSGGQQQRVALARALVYEPSVLLLDEPLGALDRALREKMQVELRRLHRKVGVTFVYVTHDQEEALTMSDHIVVIRDGAIEQTGTPEDIYSRPATEFVATFVGMANLLRAEVVQVRGGMVMLRLGDGSQFSTSTQVRLEPNDQATVLIRPENLKVRAESEPDEQVDGIPGTVIDKVFAGNRWRYRIALSGYEMQAHVPKEVPAGPGDHVLLSWDVDDCWVLPH